MLDYLIERTGNDRGWEWLATLPAGVPGTLIAFVRTSSDRPFRIGPSDAEVTRDWIAKTWQDLPAPVRVVAAE